MSVLARVAMTSSLAIYDLGSRGVLAVAPTRLSLSPSLRLSRSSVIQIHLLSSPHSTPLLTNLLCIHSTDNLLLSRPPDCLCHTGHPNLKLCTPVLHGLTSGDCNKLHLEVSPTARSMVHEF